MPHLKAGVRVLNLRLGGSGKEKVEGHGQVGQVGHEAVVLAPQDVLLERVVEHRPLLSHRDLPEKERERERERGRERERKRRERVKEDACVCVCMWYFVCVRA